MEPIFPNLPRPLKVVVDTDPAGGIFLRDIDDVLAILFLLASPEVKVEGLTVTFGNASLDKTLKVARRVRDLSCVSQLPVLSGASSWRDLGKKTAAVEFIIEYFRANADESALLTLGPLTNLASALLIEPRLVERIPAVVIMGGNINAKMPGPLKGFEFNFALAPRSADIVLRSRLKKWLAPADLCLQARFGNRELLALRSLNRFSAADRLCDIGGWIRLNRPMLGHGFCPWDPVAAAMLVKPELFEEIEELPLVMRGAGPLKKVAVEPGDIGAPCIVPKNLISPVFMDLLISRLSAI